VNENRLRGFTSFTNLQAVLSPRHLLTASVTAFSSRSQFADINSLVPQSASSNSGSKGTFATVKEIDQFSSGTLNTTFRYTQFKSNAYGQGDQDLVMNPEGLSGNAFNRWTRTANQFEMLPAFEFARKTWHGSHDLKVGTDVVPGITMARTIRTPSKCAGRAVRSPNASTSPASIRCMAEKPKSRSLCRITGF
jgi:hypothetical protein